MQRSFGSPVFEPIQERRHKEVTIGATSVFVLGLGLFALCSLCFGFGYAVGHRQPLDPSASSVLMESKPQNQTGSVQVKPSATATATQPQASAPTPAPSRRSSATEPDGTAVAVPVAAARNRNESPALPSQSGSRTSLPAQPVAAMQPTSQAAQPEPAVAEQAGGIMVQIAAVSHPEDSEVLVGALRKRGYAVSSRRDPGDGLLHVQVGPFANRTDALAMRKRLLNDGYNAIVQ